MTNKPLSRKSQRLLLILTAIAMIGAAVWLITSALRDNITFFFTPTQIQQGKVTAGQSFRVGGMVQEGSVLYSDDRLSVSFVINDTDHEITVTYDGRPPDLFAEGQGVVVRGQLQPNGSVAADEVLAKHDENYMPAEVTDALKEQGYWQEESDQ